LAGIAFAKAGKFKNKLKFMNSGGMDMENKTLKQIIQNLQYKEIIGSPEIAVLDITNDSRMVKTGSVFIAVPGYSVDGHQFITRAVKAGAAAVVVQFPMEGVSVPQIIVDNTRKAQATMACEFYDHPSHDLKIIGVTGTNGKTTSTFMIDSILKAAKLHTGLMGTLYNKVNGTILPTANTTPDSIVCQSLLRKMNLAGATHVSMEVSSHAMVMHRVDETKFTVGAITNFSPDHLDLHKNMDEYMQAKKSFFKILPPNGFAVVNLDDPGCKKISDSTPAKVLYYSLLDRRADIYMSDYRRRGSGAVVAVKVNSDKLPLESKEIFFYLAIPGRHNISNALLAASTGLVLGIDSPVIAKGLGLFRGIYRRFETIYNGKYRVIDDATHNPANMDAVFHAIEAESSNGLSVVYAIRGNRGVIINRSIAETLSFWAKRIKPVRLVITRCEDTASPLDHVKPEEEQVFRKELAGLNVDIQYKDTLRQAVSTALETVDSGETLLLMGAHPMDDVSTMFSELAGVKTTTLPRPPRFGLH